MNLYLSLAIKRSKFRSLKKRYYSENDEEETLRILCCKFRAFDQVVAWIRCKQMEEKEDEPNLVYCCCDC